MDNRAVDVLSKTKGLLKCRGRFKTKFAFFASPIRSLDSMAHINLFQRDEEFKGKQKNEMPCNVEKLFSLGGFKEWIVKKETALD